MIKKTKRYIQKHGGFGPAVKNMTENMKANGVFSTLGHMVGIDYSEGSDYRRWLKKNDPVYTDEQVEKMLSSFSLNPKISFIIPVYNVGEEYLRICIDSIRNQYYTNWEICIADDCSTAEHVKPVLDSYVELDDRIKVIYRTENGHISEASNSALTLATGEYLALVDNDDLIKPEALLEVVALINQYPDADMIYTDEDKVNEDGTLRRAPFYKPDWSPDALLCHMYITHLGVYRRSIVEEIGGFRSDFNGSQDYDLVLRVTEKTDNIYHVPGVMYHWRMLPTSAASGVDVKDYAFDAGVRAKEEALERRGTPGKVEIIERLGATNVVYDVDTQNKISIIIPNIHNMKLAETIKHYEAISTYKNVEYVFVGNESLLNELSEALVEIKEKTFYIHENIEKSIFELYNIGAQHATGSYYFFLNEYMTTNDETWLERLLGQAQVPTTGAVGPKVVMPNKTVHNTGIHLLSGEPQFAYQYWQEDDWGFFGRLLLNYNYIAISSLALMINAEKFDKMHAFNTSDFRKNYSEVDFGIRLFEEKLFNVTRGDVTMIYTQKVKRSVVAVDVDVKDKDLDTLQKKWTNYLHHDPFYNENLTQSKADYGLNKEKNNDIY